MEVGRLAHGRRPLAPTRLTPACEFPRDMVIPTILGALAIGLTLGLLGSGGSILTVPVLVYLLGHDEKVAIAESLAIVGGIALAGMLPYAKTKQADWLTVVFFGLPGMGGTYIGAWLASFVSGSVQLALFGIVMLAAAVLMLHPPKATRAAHKDSDTNSNNDTPAVNRGTRWRIAPEGLLVGILTGLLGVGGGFLIVPALVIVGGLPMRLAVGTSLIIIAMNSWTGFLKYLHVLGSLDAHVDWRAIAIFLLVGICGALSGSFLNHRINQRLLRRLFAGFLLIMAVFVLGREIPHVLQTNRSGHNADPTAVAEQSEVIKI